MMSNNVKFYLIDITLNKITLAKPMWVGDQSERVIWFYKKKWRSSFVVQVKSLLGIPTSHIRALVWIRTPLLLIQLCANYLWGQRGEWTSRGKISFCHALFHCHSVFQINLQKGREGKLGVRVGFGHLLWQKRFACNMRLGPWCGIYRF